MGKMAKLMPIVTELAGGKLQEYGLPNVMMGVMQIQAVGQQDPVVMEGVQLLTAATMGISLTRQPWVRRHPWLSGRLLVSGLSQLALSSPIRSVSWRTSR